MQESETHALVSAQHSAGGKRKGTPIKSISKDEFLNDFEKKAMGIIQLNFTREHRRLHSPSTYSSSHHAQPGKRVYTHRELGWVPRYAGTDDESYHSGDNQLDIGVANDGTAYPRLSTSGRQPAPSVGGASLATPRGRTTTERNLLTPSHSGTSSTLSNLPAQSSKRQTSPLFRRTKKPNPLDISDAQGVRDLNAEEYELCTTLRILPMVYFHARKTLIENAQARGFYKKSAAQKMLRIDVNKTGKLYDYFYSKGWLPQEPGVAAPVTLDEPGFPAAMDESGSAHSEQSNLEEEDEDE